MPSSTITTEVMGYRMEISFDWHPAYKGKTERGSGVKLEPDEPAGTDDITGIKLCDPADIFEIIAEDVSIGLDDVMAAIDAYGEGK